MLLLLGSFGVEIVVVVVVGWSESRFRLWDVRREADAGRIGSLFIGTPSSLFVLWVEEIAERACNRALCRRGRSIGGRGMREWRPELEKTRDNGTMVVVVVLGRNEADRDAPSRTPNNCTSSTILILWV